MTTTSVRRLWALVNGLPPEAAVWRPDGWTDRDELLATLVEVTDFWGRIAARQRAPRGADFGKPLRITRPGQEPPGPQVMTDPREMAAWLKANVS